MRKSIIGAACTCLAVVSFSANAATAYIGGNFTFLDSNGMVFGGTNDVTWTFDDTVINTASNGTAFNGDIASSQPFYSFEWDAHNVRVFSEGTYTFDTTCTANQISSGVSDCNNSLSPGQTEQYITFEVGAGQLGLHMLFDWHNNEDIDLAIVWDRDSVWADADGQNSPVNNLWTGAAGVSPDPFLPWQLVSTDADSDGFNGITMIDGPFQGFSANYNFNRVVPVPAAIWLFGSGLFALIGITRRQRS